MRTPILLTTLGLLIGFTAGGAWYLHGPQTGDALDASAQATPQYERWSKHNQCGAMEDIYDASLVLQANVPEAIGQNIKSILITDSALDATSELTINRADLSAQSSGGFAPECNDGVCKFTTFYPAHRAKPPEPAERRDYGLAFKTQDNQVTEVAQYPNQLVPTPEQAVSARQIPLLATIVGSTLTITITPSFDAEMWLDIRLNDANGPQQAGFAMPSTMRGVVELPFDVNPPVREASVTMTITDPYKNQRYRHRLTIADSQDPFFNCEQDARDDQPGSELED